MKRTTSSSLIRMKSYLGVSVLAVTVLPGCIPADQQGLSDAVRAALGEQVLGLVSFAVAFARQLLAAYLF